MPEITLEQLLAGRDARAEYQRTLLDAYALPLVSFTVNTPGAVKLDARAEYIFGEGARALREALAGRVMYSKLKRPQTGCEGFFVVEMEPPELKKLTVQIEQRHALGRLFDIDVLMPPTGGNERGGGQISREALGLPRRRCLICGEDAAACVRSRAHSPAELNAEIDRIVAKYKEAQSAQRV